MSLLVYYPKARFGASDSSAASERLEVGPAVLDRLLQSVEEQEQEQALAAVVVQTPMPASSAHAHP